MSSTRREFLGAGAGALCAPLLASASAEEPDRARPAVNGPRCLDYGRSFLCGTATFNAVRFWVESRTTIIDPNGRRTEYYQCASCKSEHTFAERGLFQEDNYDFLPVFGGGDLLIFRRPARLSANYRQVRREADVWGTMLERLPKADKVVELGSWDEIRDATAAGVPIVTRTEISDAETGLRAEIECPTKTMNISLERKLYQVDTGPIALPDLTKRHEPEIESLRLAFIAFNAPHFADFVVEQPTPVIEDGKELTRIHHYSGPISLPAKNTIFAVAPD